MSNGTVILKAKPAPAKTTAAAKPGAPKPVAKKKESSSEDSGNYILPSQSQIGSLVLS